MDNLNPMITIIKESQQRTDNAMKKLERAIQALKAINDNFNE